METSAAWGLKELCQPQVPYRRCEGSCTPGTANNTEYLLFFFNDARPTVLRDGSLMLTAQIGHEEGCFADAAMVSTDGEGLRWTHRSNLTAGCCNGCETGVARLSNQSLLAVMRATPTYMHTISTVRVTAVAHLSAQFADEMYVSLCR